MASSTNKDVIHDHLYPLPDKGLVSVRGRELARAVGRRSWSDPIPRSARELGLAELRLYADAVFASTLLYCANAIRGAARERLAADGELVHMSTRLD